MKTVLGIETTCDETAAAVVSLDPDGAPVIRANEVLSQIAEHAAYGGVVPEIAARAHVEVLDRLIARALERAGTRLSDLDGIAVAAGPGLIGGVLVGLVTAKTLALVANKPLLAVNHLEAHALTARLTDGLDFPYLLLLASGGHTQLVAVRGVGDYVRLGGTIDDAIGEAFDKAAKLLGLGYPGGPEVERMAEAGDPERFALPRPMLGRREADFSLSGLKTALRIEAERTAPAGRARRGRPLRRLPGGGGRCGDRPHPRGPARLLRPGRAADRPGRGGGRRRQRRDPAGAGRAGGGGRARLRRAAAAPVRRQRRDDRLGRSGAPAARPRGRHHRPGPPALAAGGRARAGHGGMNAPDRRAAWRDLVERRLPEAARTHRDWPVRLDHCFARILLDHACGGPWRDHVAPPAHANLPADRLEAAIALGEAVLAGEADLHALNRRSLAWRGKLRQTA